jgi:hypothetical protein
MQVEMQLTATQCHAQEKRMSVAETEASPMPKLAATASASNICTVRIFGSEIQRLRSKQTCRNPTAAGRAAGIRMPQASNWPLSRQIDHRGACPLFCQS